MVEMSERLDRVERRLNESARKLGALSETMHNPPTARKPATHFAPHPCYRSSPYRDHKYLSKENSMEEVLVEDYNKLVEAYVQKEQIGKEMKTIIQEYMMKTKELEDKVLQLSKENKELASSLNNAEMLLSKTEESKKKVQYLVTELEEERSRSQNEFKRWKGKKKELKEAISAKDITIDNLKLELEYAKKIADGKTSDLAELKVKVRALETTNEKLKATATDKDNQIGKLEKSIVTIHSHSRISCAKNMKRNLKSVRINSMNSKD
eukprot:TRINITY_DN5166_c0_g2_i1.p1 TRINITY_DN5166_c0_g2~~TRINITY_DN5166_c0_g2_i1.p1  ORF type:complete len:266 (+),score=69.72 TRINITY_DN5166_c0_g2_i1:121-918(+)